MKTTLVKIAAFFALVVFNALFLCGATYVASQVGKSHARSGIWWNEYQATVGGWKVSISESENEGEQPFRVVHIISATNSLYGITGHGDMVGGWKRIFWCGFPSATNGSNSYIQDGGEWRWQPCTWDSGMAPIPASDIPKAIVLLDAAMTNRNIDNLRIVWTRGGTTYLKRGE